MCHVRPSLVTNKARVVPQPQLLGGYCPVTVPAGTAPAPAPQHAPASTLAAPTDSEMKPEVEQATAPDSGTVAPAVTTTEVRGVAAGLATMAVAGPSTAPPAAPSATPVAPAAPVANTVGQELQSVVVAAVTSAVTATTERLMEAFTQVSQVTKTTPSASEKMTVRDLKLPGFAGSKSDSANYIEPDFYLPLLIWSR